MATTKQHVHVVLETDLVSKIDRRAKRERRTKTEVIRQALLRYLVQIDRGEEN
jgi:metal-responsive CopG/Arc/MetJ family transcriptional regulator